MFDLIFNKDDSFFLKKKLSSTRGAPDSDIYLAGLQTEYHAKVIIFLPQEMDAKFRFAIHIQ